MTPRYALTLLTSLLFAASAGSESFSGSIGFGTGADFQGELWFTALDPGETSSSLGAFSGYTQTASLDYTYLYLLENDSNPGETSDFCDTHCFVSFEIEMLFDPVSGGVSSVGFDDSNSGESPSDFGPFSSPDLVFWDFDLAPPDGNHGIVPGGASAFLRFYSQLAPTNLGGAFITNNETPTEDFIHLSTGITVPVPEPASGGLLALGLAALAARRRGAGR